MPCRLVCQAVLAALLIGFTISAEAEQRASTESLESPARWLERAVDHAQQIKDAEARSQAHYNLTYALTQEGDFAGALRSASEVTNPQTRVYAFGRIARLAHEKSDTATCDRALQVAREVAISAKNLFSNSHVIQLYFELNRPEEAISFAAAVPDQQQKRYAYRNVADEMAKKGRIDEAIAMIARHHPVAWRDSGYASMAQACATASRFDQAIELAEQIEKTDFCDTAYDHIAERLIHADRLEEAKAIALRIKDERKRSDRLAAHLSASVTAKDGAKSIDEAMAEATTREQKVSLGMLRFAELVAQGEVEKAEALIVSLVKVIEDSPRAPEVSKFGKFDDSLQIAMVKAGYMEIAGLLKEEGDEAGAKERIAQAIAAAEAIESPSLGKMVLAARLVRRQAELGDIEGALTSTRLFDTELTRTNATGDLAATCILSGDVDKGLELAREIVRQPDYAHGTYRVAAALIQVKRFDELADYLPLIPDTGSDVRTFRDIAREVVKSGNISQLDQLLASHPSHAARAQACLGAYDQLAVRERPEKDSPP